MADFDTHYGLATDDKLSFSSSKARDFYKTRRMFVIKDNKVILAPEESDLSHAEWLKEIGIISFSDTYFMEHGVRGYFDNKDTIYFYTGFDFRITPEIEKEFFGHFEELKKVLGVQTISHIFGGTKDNGSGNRVGIKQYQ